MKEDLSEDFARGAEPGDSEEPGDVVESEWKEFH